MSVTAAETRSDVLMRELWHVAGIGDVTRLEQILAQGVEVNASDRTGVTALMRAAYHGELATVEVLIEHGADLDAKDSGGLTALMMAKHSGHVEIVDALLSSGATEIQKRRATKTLPVDDPELEETPVAVTNEKPRTLHEPPEIWEMVHTTQVDAVPETISARGFNLADKLPAARTLLFSTIVLIVAAGPSTLPPLSMTSGYSVPWAKNFALAMCRASSLNTSMKTCPIVLRLACGSAIPANAERNRSRASTTCKSALKWSRNVRRTASTSFARNSPLSTKMHATCGPTALTASSQTR